MTKVSGSTILINFVLQEIVTKIKLYFLPFILKFLATLVWLDVSERISISEVFQVSSDFCKISIKIVRIQFPDFFQNSKSREFCMQIQIPMGKFVILIPSIYFHDFLINLFLVNLVYRITSRKLIQTEVNWNSSQLFTQFKQMKNNSKNFKYFLTLKY
jgi:hypothetical protein